MRMGTMLVMAAAVLQAASGVGCGSDDPGQGAQGAGGGGASGGAGGSGASSGAGGDGGQGGAGQGGSGGAGQGGGAPSDCAALAQAIAAQAAGVVTCTSVVRLDYTSHAVLGYRIQCGPYAQTTEAEARAAAQTDTGFGAAGQSLAGAAPEDDYVFYESPGDFGGAAAVSARSGLTAFGGGIVWDGAGDITYPAAWDPPAGLGDKCTPASTPPAARGFDLRGGSALPAADVDAALAVVWQTALPDGLWAGGYVFDAMVLLYPRTVGAFDPATAEWIVLVNSGWLE